MKCLVAAILFLFLMGCDSPLNHRVNERPENFNVQSQDFEFPSYGLSFSADWLEGPFENVNQNSVLILHLYDSNGRLVDLPEELQLGFFALMPSMGHPLDSAGEFQRISKGIYLNEEIRFQMPGEWQMEISILDQDYYEKDVRSWLIEF